MEFVFTCPEHNKVFESAEFSILEYNGVVTDRQGNKFLDAKVALDEPCPFCGGKHVYHATELVCPLGQGLE